jgi:TolB-like protein/DNA-binding winged helix-turn-helix (wHTH) protein
VNLFSTGAIVLFGAFQADLRARELRRSGLTIKLQEKPFRLLEALLEHPGELVAREDLRQKLWSGDAPDDFEQSLNIAVHKLRAALRDSGRNPRFIEAVARGGYRFIAPVGRLGPGSSGAPGVPGQRLRLVVLPFRTGGADVREEQVAEGITEELITRLGSAPWHALRVGARSSAAQYERSARPTADVSWDLRADYLIEGSVRCDAGRARVAARLIEAPGQTHLWAQMYDRQVTDALAVQGEVAADIADSVLRLLSTETACAGEPVSPGAREAYLTGRYHLERGTQAALRKAITFFELVIGKEPRCALAHVGLADCYLFLGGYCFLSPKQAFPRAEAAVAEALEIDERLCEAHSTLGFIRLHYQWDWAGGEKELRRAIELNPGCAGAHLYYAWALLADGRAKEAQERLARAKELDPLSLQIAAVTAWAHWLAGRHNEAVEEAGKAVERVPRFFLTHLCMVLACAAKSRFEEAARYAGRAVALSGSGPMMVAVLGQVHACAGRVREARKVLDRLARASRWRYVPWYWVAAIHALLGRKDEAFACLQDAFDDHCNWLPWLKVDPRFASLRSDPCFAALVRRVGLPCQLSAGALRAGG